MNKLIIFIILPVLFAYFLKRNLQEITGIQYGKSAVSVDEAYTKLKESLQKNEQISIMAELDHALNAQSVGLELDPSKIIFFGNPELGTPLMQKNQLTALDLPLRVLFYEQGESVFAVYNSNDYLESRYALSGAENLTKIANSLEKLVKSALQNPVNKSESQNVAELEGIVTLESAQDFEETYESLKNTINQNEELTFVAEVDHQNNAEKIGLELRPTKVIYFGNPKIGTPLMQNSPTAGLDLPQKMLIWESAAGTVFVSYNDPEFLQTRHQIKDRDDEIRKIKSALEKLAHAAANP